MVSASEKTPLVPPSGAGGEQPKQLFEDEERLVRRGQWADDRLLKGRFEVALELHCEHWGYSLASDR